MSSKMAYLCTIPLIPKDYNLLSVQRYVALAFALIEDVLSNKNYAEVVVMTAFVKRFTMAPPEDDLRIRSSMMINLGFGSLSQLVFGGRPS